MPKFTPAEDARILACPVTPRSERRNGKPSPMQLLADELGRNVENLRHRKRRLTQSPEKKAAETTKHREYQRRKYQTDPAFRAADNERTREAQRRRRAKT